jgi:hypothetical protein
MNPAYSHIIFYEVILCKKNVDDSYNGDTNREDNKHGRLKKSKIIIFKKQEYTEKKYVQDNTVTGDCPLLFFYMLNLLTGKLIKKIDISLLQYRAITFLHDAVPLLSL